MQPSSTTSAPLPPVDLELRVTTPWGRAGQRFEFVLNSPSGVAGFHQETIRGPEVRSPEVFQQKLFEQLESLNLGLDVDGAPILPPEILQELTTIGRDLYVELFPREMRTIYREIRDRVSTLLVTSDEPWIPWEIVRPAEREDDDFLCVKHQMSRWLTGEAVLVADRHVETLLCVEAGASSGLDKAADEAEFMDRFARDIPGLRHRVHNDPSFEDLVHLLERESFDLLHFAGHGEHDPRRPGEAKLALSDRLLRARHLSPIAEQKLRQERPFVFFNSCQGGQLGTSLTQLDGWAQRWVRRCGCSAFLAPAWCVGDTRAQRFAEVFYQELYAGRTLGEAVQIARLTLRQENPGEPAWLTYRVYGSPNARIRFGDHAPPRPGPFVETPALPPAETRFEPRAPQPQRPTPRTPPRDGGTRGGTGPAPQREVSRLRAAWMVASALALVVAIGIWSKVSEPGVPRQGATAEKPAESGEKKSGSEVAATAVVPPPPSSQKPATEMGAKTSTGSSTPPPASPPKSAVPLSPMVPGKVAVIALDAGNMAPSSGFAAAIRSALLESAGGQSVQAPSIGAGPARELAEGTFRFGASPGQTPWGAEYLLVATASSQNLQQSVPQIRSVSLTVSAELLRAADGTSVAHASDTHTGAGPSDAAALTQAATRCLRSITNYLDQGGSP